METKLYDELVEIMKKVIDNCYPMQETDSDDNMKAIIEAAHDIEQLKIRIPEIDRYKAAMQHTSEYKNSDERDIAVEIFDSAVCWAMVYLTK